MRLIFLGPPGSGKGTQAKMLGAKLHIPQLSTGDLLRAAVRGGSELGREARKYMDAGKLAPDDLVIQLILARMQQKDCEEGFILDGFPRTLNQAEALDKAFAVKRIKIDAAISFEIEEHELLDRLTGRRVCPNGHGEWHIRFHLPKNPGFCDTCHAPLMQREDDQESKIRVRLAAYRKDTEPLKKYYADLKLLRPVPADGPMAEITQQLETTVKQLS
jgi:adenylate kinase